MDFLKLGRCGLDVSRLCLGCMSFGVPERGAHPWTLDANSYSDGTSEEITGRALHDFARRDEVVVATKVFFSNGKGPNSRGLSRKVIMVEIDASLRRLGWERAAAGRQSWRGWIVRSTRVRASPIIDRRKWWARPTWG
jgi:1-deoxyxylulose-5-phosphate synthase